MKENSFKLEDFAEEETKEERYVYSSIDVVHSENVKPEKNHLHDVHSLQYRINTLSIKKRKMSFACFKVKKQNIFRLALICRYRKSSPFSKSI